MRSRETIRAVVGCIAGTVVQSDVVDIKPSAVANTEAMNGVVLDVDVMDCARSQDFAELNEVIRSGNGSAKPERVDSRVTHLAIPPLLPRPSHHDWPLPSRIAPGAAVISRLVPPTLMNG